MQNVEWIGRLIVRRRALLAASVLACSLAAAGCAAIAPDKDDARNWVGTWAASPQTQESGAVPLQLDNQTVRQIVHTSIGGSVVRVRLSNEFGRTPLVVGAAHIALQLPGAGASTAPGTDRALTFGGRPSVTIPAGAPALSDPIALDVPALTNLAVSIYLPASTAATTLHSLGRQTTYVSSQGNFAALGELPVASTTQSWYFLSGVSVATHRRAAAIVALGDSITDGFASTVDANRRYPNLLAQRLQATPRLQHLAVLNHGISGNRTLHDFVGPGALARFDRDVVAAPGVRYVILLEGINNIGFPTRFKRPADAVSAEDIIAGHRQMIERARERGLKVYGATLTPYEGTTFADYFTPEGEVKRQAVNHWIRTSGKFDAVIDFDRIVRDPSQPSRLLPAYDSGDHLHPNDAGYQAMADAIDVSLFDDEHR